MKNISYKTNRNTRWAAHIRVMDFCYQDVVLNASLPEKMTLEIFAYDLNEPVIAEKLLELAEKR